MPCRSCISALNGPHMEFVTRTIKFAAGNIGKPLITIFCIFSSLPEFLLRLYGLIISFSPPKSAQLVSLPENKARICSMETFDTGFVELTINTSPSRAIGNVLISTRLLLVVCPRNS